MQWYLEALKNYANFKGRARRKEYWLFNLFHILIMGTLYLAGSAMESLLLFVVILIYYFLTLIPYLSVTVRRLHDIGYSGWMYLVNFIPLVGGIILLVFTCLDSDANENKYGANPKILINQSA
ncbi:DUF805 domain-containing protein [Mesobacillus selenatarsenatis]|uniref:DUF805 domain-containing protein n=1 Tax=Mesobacillus selenatarsenatis TaxID=388741 RepID=A0A846TH73_9BACI|nr:DUF805 domain-containing protein [Mesobacillus selenatarsenatis]NKE04767.1 DUF805 domain-containing protein [Mesobacillus selenatarsenatis]